MNKIGCATIGFYQLDNYQARWRSTRLIAIAGAAGVEWFAHALAPSR
jgi:hypothetical protein